MREAMKPHIYKKDGFWFCWTDRPWNIGKGTSPYRAFIDWKLFS